MQYWLSITTIPEQDQLLDLARLAESLGFDGITLADHVLMPTRIESRYPYTEDGEVWWTPETPWPDPWVTLASMGAVTSRLKLASNICLAALRDPAVLAKAVTTAAVLTNERVVLGAAVGWLREEYDLLGVPFEQRGRRLDELLALFHLFCSGKAFAHEGEFFRYPEVLMSPAPKRPVPVWCGGAAPAALRRAARQDGWLGLPLDRASAPPMIQTLRDERKRAGLPLDDFAINIALTEAHEPATIRELEEQGVTGLMIMAPWLPNPFFTADWYDPEADPARFETKRAALERFAEQVLSSAGQP
ncbi:LLM class oxidoreductase [Haliea atlantica]|nr:LLM class F420-dependent oxidoreductase [Haliea sp.]|tara:strand:- start:124013 stop:124921 length:909 start_codon:yes stop_codon:yes gene_type:complete